MKWYLLYLIAILISCNNSGHKEKIVIMSTSDSTRQQKLAAKANYLYMNDSFAEAVRCYDTLISIDSTKAGYYFKRGYSKAGLLHSFDEAKADYLKSIEKNYSEKASAFQNLGVLCYLEKRYDSALYFYNECLKINPNDEKANQQKSEVLEIINKSK